VVMSARQQYKQIYLALLTALKRLITWRRDPPEDPYSYVTAPRKPKPPHLSASAVVDRPEE
jgi:hypothetical protein